VASVCGAEDECDNMRQFRRDAVLPAYEKLYKGSAEKHDTPLSGHSSDIKLLEDKRSLLKQLEPQKKHGELASAIMLLSIRVGRIIGAFIASLMDENTVRLWLKEQRDAAEKLAQDQAAAFQAQIESLWAELQVATGGAPGAAWGWR
ncbi:hypothetical protein Tco_0520780, partial [Tanacetum coccineum]